jgi:hypothetical protein
MSLTSNYLPIASLCPPREPIQAEDSTRRQERRQGDAPCCPPMKGGTSTMARVTRARPFGRLIPGSPAKSFRITHLSTAGLLRCGISIQLMSQMGHSRPKRAKQHDCLCPLCPESRQTDGGLAKSALCRYCCRSRRLKQRAGASIFRNGSHHPLVAER